MDDCIFCKIVKGDIPSYKITETDDLLVFLDAFPQHQGHTLIIPKQHFENAFDLPDEISSQILPLARRVAIAMEKTINADGYNFLQNNREESGQTVFHYHMHIVPRFKAEHASGLKHIFHPDGYEYKPSREDLKKIAEKIAEVV